MIEVHIDSPTGPIVAEKMLEVAPEVDMTKLMAELEAGEKKAATTAPGSTTGASTQATAKPAPPRNRFAAPPVIVPVKATNGVHDLYFVFKNDKAKAMQPLLSLSSIRFMDK